ncbi:MAG: hypothetical protein IJ870_01740 [Alphaproteobacteria bacterium]|nr:hypothetical protein [Alphaproteobacteria bacterium]
MQNITDLLQEAKPLYKTRKRNRKLLAVGSTLGVFFLTIGLSFNLTRQTKTPIYDFWGDEIEWVQNGSAIEDMGLPVDSNGLLWII